MRKSQCKVFVTLKKNTRANSGWKAFLLQLFSSRNKMQFLCFVCFKREENNEKRRKLHRMFEYIKTSSRALATENKVKHLESFSLTSWAISETLIFIAQIKCRRFYDTEADWGTRLNSDVTIWRNIKIGLNLMVLLVALKSWDFTAIHWQNLIKRSWSLTHLRI